MQNIYPFEPKTNAPRVMINVRKNQWNCLQVESLLSIYVSAALTFIADDGDAHAKRCFLYLEKNAQVTDESLKSEFAQITKAPSWCVKKVGSFFCLCQCLPFPFGAPARSRAPFP